MISIEELRCTSKALSRLRNLGLLIIKNLLISSNSSIKTIFST